MSKRESKNVHMVIVGGKQKADFLIGMLLEKGYRLTIINDDRLYSEYLSEKYNHPVVFGNPARIYTLQDAEITRADILIAQTAKDADNFVICKAAKKIFGVQRTVATVNNPKNVEVFKALDINTVISAAYTVATIIEQASIVGDITNTLTLDDDKVVITKLLITETSPILGKQLQDITFPSNVIISCIIRDTGITVPNGQTVITLGDKLMIVSDKGLQQQVAEIVNGVAHN